MFCSRLINRLPIFLLDDFDFRFIVYWLRLGQSKWPGLLHVECSYDFILKFASERG